MVKNLFRRRPSEDIMQLQHRINEVWSDLLIERHRIDVLKKENEALKAEIEELKLVKINDNEADATQLLNEFFCGAKGDYK